jgi:hypothetical protein
LRNSSKFLHEKKNNPMRTYDVYHVREHNATVSVQDDGQKVWTFGEWKDFWVDADTQKAIEWVIDHDPNTETMVYEKKFTIQKRSA